MLEACSSGQCMGCITSPPDLTVRTVYAGSGEGAGPAPQVVQASEAGAAIADTGRLFLRNLSYAATETDLTALLQPYGDVTEVHLVLDKCALLNPLGALLVKTRPSDDVEALKHKCIADYLARIINSSCLRPFIRQGRDAVCPAHKKNHVTLNCRATKKSKGIALAQFAEPADAVDAHISLDGTVFQGRLLHMLPGHRRPPGPAEKETAEVGDVVSSGSLAFSGFAGGPT